LHAKFRYGKISVSFICNALSRRKLNQGSHFYRSQLSLSLAGCLRLVSQMSWRGYFHIDAMVILERASQEQEFSFCNTWVTPKLVIKWGKAWAANQ